METPFCAPSLGTVSPPPPHFKGQAPLGVRAPRCKTAHPGPRALLSLLWSQHRDVSDHTLRLGGSCLGPWGGPLHRNHVQLLCWRPDYQQVGREVACHVSLKPVDPGLPEVCAAALQLGCQRLGSALTDGVAFQKVPEARRILFLGWAREGTRGWGLRVESQTPPFIP